MGGSFSKPPLEPEVQLVCSVLGISTRDAYAYKKCFLKFDTGLDFFSSHLCFFFFVCLMAYFLKLFYQMEMVRFH